LDGGLKKWFMLQVWRLQQVAQVLTIVLLAITLSLQLYDYVRWRAGPLFETPYVGVPILLLILAIIIWCIAIYWDLRLKMWREQATVLIERNPYTKEKLTSKEIVVYGLMWLPIMEKMAKDDPKLAEAVEIVKQWMKRVSEEDPNTIPGIKDIFDHIGKDGMGLLGLEKK